MLETIEINIYLHTHWSAGNLCLLTPQSVAPLKRTKDETKKTPAERPLTRQKKKKKTRKAEEE